METDEIWAEILEGPEKILPKILAKDITRLIIPQIRKLLVQAFVDGGDYAMDLMENSITPETNWAYKEAKRRYIK
jgi:hypothetical protein